jgi:Pvc16 N-terminal domain
LGGEAVSARPLLLSPMIDIALRMLKAEMNAFLIALPDHTGPAPVIIANVAALEQADGNTSGLEEKILLSLVNVEEESTFKNLPAAIKTSDGGVRYTNPPIYLNLYLLFCANFPIGQYENALRQLSNVIRFFQGRRVFNLKNSPNFTIADETPDMLELELALNLYTMTFEQINHLWGSLGGKQMPFVMYKGRLVRITDNRQTGSGTLIEEVGADGKNFNN